MKSVEIDPRAITRIEVRIVDVRPGDVILHSGAWCYVYGRATGDDAKDLVNTGIDPKVLDIDTVDSRDVFIRLAIDNDRRDGSGSYADDTVRFKNPNELVTIQSPGYDDDTA